MIVTTNNGLPDATDAMKQTFMRNKRDALLAQSDWTQMPDSPLSDSKKQEWATYRQALRDFPASWTPADTANFPDQPSWVAYLHANNGAVEDQKNDLAILIECIQSVTSFERSLLGFGVYGFVSRIPLSLNP